MIQARGLKQITPSRALAEQHYGVHKERPFFAGLVDFITSGPVVAMVWAGWRDRQRPQADWCSLEAEPGTIRGDLAINIGRNVIHALMLRKRLPLRLALVRRLRAQRRTPSDQTWRVES